jgi:hypothetical protein
LQPTVARRHRGTVGPGSHDRRKNHRGVWTIGIAAPIILQFDAPISDMAAVERALTVTCDPPTAGSWAWLSG